jgi:hypothetical protein
MKTPNKKLADKSPRPNAEVYAEYLRERIYGSITLAGINLGLLLGVNHISVNHAFTTVITTSLGLWSASLFAEIVSYRIMHEKRMARGEIIHHVIVHRGILVAALPTIVLLTFSALETDIAPRRANHRHRTRTHWPWSDRNTICSNNNE